MESPWQQIFATWIRAGSSAPAGAEGVSAFHEVGGPTQLLLSPTRPMHPGAWTEFGLRHAHAPDGIANPARSAYLLAVRIVAPGNDRDEFRRWLHDEHAALQVSLAGVNWFLGYEEDGHEPSFLNLWSIDAPDVVEGDAWAQIRDTPWWRRVAHVTAGADRGIFRAD